VQPLSDQHWALATCILVLAAHDTTIVLPGATEAGVAEKGIQSGEQTFGQSNHAMPMSVTAEAGTWMTVAAVVADTAAVVVVVAAAVVVVEAAIAVVDAVAFHIAVAVHVAVAEVGVGVQLVVADADVASVPVLVAVHVAPALAVAASVASPLALVPSPEAQPFSWA